MHRFAENLKHAMQEKNISFYKLAGIAGISDRQIQRYTEGKSEPTLSTLVMIANALDMTLDELTGYNEMTAEEKMAAKVNNGRPNTSVPIDGEKIRRLLKERGIKHSVLALVTGYSSFYVSAAVTNDRMTAEMLKAVCKALNVSERDIRI